MMRLALSIVIAGCSMSPPYPTVVPKSRPTPAVSAIASAPQNITRSKDLLMGAPPATAPSAPSAAKQASETMATAGLTGVQVQGQLPATEQPHLR